MANLGYDLWIGNNRGTVNSLEHETLTSDDKAFWNFTFHEMGVYDLPANLDYVLNQTSSPKIFYLGHSQGTMQFWIANMYHEDIGSKIEKFVAFAPVMYETHSSSLIVKGCLDYEIDNWLFKHFTEVLVFQNKDIMGWIINHISPYVLEMFPTTTWMFVQGIVGINKVSHMDN